MEPMHHLNQDNLSSQASLEQHAPIVDAISKEHHQRLFKRGLNWLGAGVLMMALSFGINFFLSGTDVSVTTVMYVMTSVGTLCIIKALGDILGF
jgi:hypothetical protein